MARKPLFSIRAVLFLSFIIALGTLASCSDDGPAGTTGSPDLTGKGEVDPQGDPDFFLGSTSIDGVPDGRIDVWAYNLTVHEDSTDSNSAATVVAFDVVLINRSPTAVHAPVTFFIPLIIPNSVTVLNSEIVYITDITEGPPGFDFSDDLGDDNQLDPREHSAPVNMQFGMRELTSFSIGFEITVGSPPPPSGDPDISGVVFNDLNENGDRDDTEEGIPGVKVHLSSNTPNTDPFDFVRVALTDREGRYGFADLRPGIYKVEAAPHSDLKPTTPNPLIVTLVGDSSGVIPIRGVDFGFFVKEPPDVDPIFGPVGVGPGSNHGTDFEGGFRVEDIDRNHKYVLQVMPPPIMTSSPIVMRIDKAEVRINQEHVYKFECESDSVGTTNTCLPVERVSIPGELLMEGANRIRIHVEGSERAFLTFTIFRVADPAGP
jgi:hypothetical protein